MAAVLVVGVLPLAAWRADWPPAIFGRSVALHTAQRETAGRLSARQETPAAPTTIPAPPTSSVAESPSSSASPATAGAASSPAESASNSPAGPALSDPAKVVIAYFSAITAKRYARAWELGGVNTGAGSYSAFVNGFATTASNRVTILSASGNVVTARLTAQQTYGSVKVFKGTYTVAGGVIVQFDVQQIS